MKVTKHIVLASLALVLVAAPLRAESVWSLSENQLEQVETQEVRIYVNGSNVRVKVIKNKVAPPFRKAEFEILFGHGISKVGEIIDLGVQYGIVKKSGAWFSYEGTKLGQGRDAAKQLVADNPELADEIEAKIMAAMHGAPAE